MKATGIDGIIYHDRCPDGKAGAWVFWRENKREVETGKIFLQGLSHGQPPPTEINGLTILIVDFCFPRDILIEMASKAKKIIILDHHKSAKKSLDASALPTNIETVFDMKRSGAQIAWDYVYPGVERPWFIDIIADRDLWQWKIPHSKEIGKALSVGGWYTLENMEFMFRMAKFQGAVVVDSFKEDMIKMGTIEVAQEEKELSIICSKAILAEFKVPIRSSVWSAGADGLDVFKVKLVGCPSNFRSEVGNRLCDDSDIDFAVMWQYDFLLDEWWISCRGQGEDTDETAIDLSEICSRFERGGGHPNAAGFTIFGSDRTISIKRDDGTSYNAVVKGQKLQDYFRAIEVPRNRPQDQGLVSL